ncbi:TPA: hypothetical protein GXX44_00600 [bacterium]|nr:hypothetical protein [bacterium]
MLDKLKGIFQKYGISIAYFFGSQKDLGLNYLSGEKVNPDPDSDLDIGLYLKSLPKNMFDFYGSLYSELSDIFEHFHIDVVFLNEVDYLIKYEIISGHRIYAEDEDFADEYEERVMKFAEDINFKQKLFEKDFLEALRDGYFEIKLKQDPE